METSSMQSNAQDTVNKLILEFFESTESAKINDLIYFLYDSFDDFPDIELIKVELKRLESEGIIVLRGDDISLLSRIDLKKNQGAYHLGDWNYKLVADILLPGNKNVDYREIRASFNKLDFLNDRQNKFMVIRDLDLDLRKEELRIEFSSNEWDGTVIISKNQIEIQTVWKIHDSSSEWEEYVIQKSDKNTIKEILMSMPTASIALSLYFTIKAIITDIHTGCQFKIITAESIRSQRVSSVK